MPKLIVKANQLEYHDEHGTVYLWTPGEILRVVGAKADYFTVDHVYLLLEPVRGFTIRIDESEMMDKLVAWCQAHLDQFDMDKLERLYETPFEELSLELYTAAGK